MENKVIAISGYSGSGKTTTSEYIINNRNDFIYFDFGYLFRTLTYYLINILNIDKKDIKGWIESNKLYTVNFSYKIQEKKVSIGINDCYFKENQLNNPQMNLDTVMIGSLIGDKLNKVLYDIINELKKENNVLLNARRPKAVYKDLDYHFFLKANFEERVKRKSMMNNESLLVTRNKLLERDKLEKSSGFWLVDENTIVIDTTNNKISKVIKSIESKISTSKYDKKYRITSLNNLTLILGSYKCNKNCPYCIAKNNKKFSCNDYIEKLDKTLMLLKNNSFSFNRFVLSGNGEPSLYSTQDLIKIRNAIVKNKELFNTIRIHTSGNIFHNKEKYDIFNNMGIPVEFEVLRVSLDSDIDRNILKYQNNYLESELFINSQNIKCDIALTDYLELDNINYELYEFLKKYPSIKKIRFKELMHGDNLENKEGIWVKKHTLNKDIIKNIILDLNLVKYNNIFSSENGKIIYKACGSYDKDIVINNGILQDYNHNNLNIKQLKLRYGDKNE